MKTFLPPLIAFMAFSVFVITIAYAQTMQIGNMGEGNVHAFMACFYYCWPLYFICAVLTQWIVIVPVWEVFVLRSALGAIVTFILVAIVCTLAAGGVANFIWDDQSGDGNLIGLTTIMLMIQLAYWAVNFFIMFLVTGKAVKLKRGSKHETIAAEE